MLCRSLYLIIYRNNLIVNSYICSIESSELSTQDDSPRQIAGLPNPKTILTCSTEPPVALDPFMTAAPKWLTAAFRGFAPPAILPRSFGLEFRLDRSPRYRIELHPRGTLNAVADGIHQQISYYDGIYSWSRNITSFGILFCGNALDSYVCREITLRGKSGLPHANISPTPRL